MGRAADIAGSSGSPEGTTAVGMPAVMHMALRSHARLPSAGRSAQTCVTLQVYVIRKQPERALKDVDGPEHPHAVGLGDASRRVLTSESMDISALTIIGVGAAPLVAVGAACRSVREERRTHGGRVDAPGEDLRERMARFEGLRDAVACTRVG